MVGASYVRSGVTYQREIFSSRPDDAIVLHFGQNGGGRYTGTITLEGTHGEAAATSFGAAFANGLKYGAAVTAYGSGGRVTVSGAHITFSGCKDLTVVVSGGTNYAPDPAHGYRDPKADPQKLARNKVRAAAEHSADTLLRTQSPTTARRSARLASRSASRPPSSARSTPGSASSCAPRAASRTPNSRPPTCSSAAISWSARRAAACPWASRGCGWTATTRTGWAITTPTSTSR